MKQSDCIDSPCIKEAGIEGFSEKESEDSDFKFPGKTSFWIFQKHKGFQGLFNWIGVLLFTLFTFMALFPSIIAPYAPEERFIPYETPSEEHLLGTNDRGNDILWNWCSVQGSQ